jgi:hypothetical protein
MKGYVFSSAMNDTDLFSKNAFSITLIMMGQYRQGDSIVLSLEAGDDDNVP